MKKNKYRVRVVNTHIEDVFETDQYKVEDDAYCFYNIVSPPGDDGTKIQIIARYPTQYTIVNLIQ